MWSINYYFGKFNNVNLSTIVSQNEKNTTENLKLLKTGEMLILKEGNDIIVKPIKEETIKTTNSIKFDIEPFYKQENILLDEYKLSNCKINLNDYERTLIFNEDNYSMYILITKKTANNDKKKRVFLINFAKESKNLSPFITLINYQVKDIKAENGKNKFIKDLKELLNIKVKTCQLNYYECQIDSEGIKLNENKYFEISGNKVNVIKQDNKSKDGVQYEDNKLKNIEIIEDLLKIELTSEIYNFNKKREQISCNCNLI